MKIIFNGILLEANDPAIQVSPFSASIVFGQSVFETFKIVTGSPPATIKQHWERLFKSAQILQFAVPNSFNQSQLDTALMQLLRVLDLSHNYRVKVLVCTDFWWMKAERLLPISQKIYSQGVRVTDRIETRILPAAKAASPLYPLDAHLHSVQGVFETFYFSPAGFLLEASMSNVIAVIDQQLITPEAGVLPGITVREVLKTAQSFGFKTAFKNIARAELKQASEIFLTNSIKGLVPVKSWNDWERKSTEVYDRLKDEC